MSADHRQRCLASTEGDEALLWASMAVAAHAVRRQASPPVPGDTTPSRTRVGSRDQAVVVLLSQVRALVYGLEVGMGVLSISSKEFASARTRLTQVLVLRDSLLEQISSTSLSPPPVELAYAMPGDLTTSATIRSTWGALENGVLAGWARLAAASPSRRRPAALEAMQQQADRVQGSGASLTYWPGWVGGDVG